MRVTDRGDGRCRAAPPPAVSPEASPVVAPQGRQASCLMEACFTPPSTLRKRRPQLQGELSFAACDTSCGTAPKCAYSA